MWPEIVHASEIQSRLLMDGIPVERAMAMVSEIALVPIGERYKVDRAQGDLFLYKMPNPGYYTVAAV